MALFRGALHTARFGANRLPCIVATRGMQQHSLAAQSNELFRVAPHLLGQWQQKAAAAPEALDVCTSLPALGLAIEHGLPTGLSQAEAVLPSSSGSVEPLQALHNGRTLRKWKFYRKTYAGKNKKYRIKWG
mmetsp:Transcript_10596/g.24112  ORF Transcript_10596/g.24112 Transcript_10596/m.24112 type:complete len:131 (+) Transcript_10596:107-499(+)